MFRTLIVEDNAVFRQSFKEILHMQFPYMAVDEAVDGEQALQKIDSFRPDVIFMDIVLPGENGLEVTKKIKAGYPAITIIILTNYDLPEYRDAANEYGANYFISKSSSTREEILTLLKSILSGLGFNHDGQKGTEKS